MRARSHGPSLPRALTLFAVVVLSFLPEAARGQAVELTGLARAASDKHVLSCIRVVLEDSARHDVASTRTDARGLFAVGAPGPGVYRLRFELWVAAPVLTPPDTLATGAYSERVYDLPFDIQGALVTHGPPPGTNDLRPRSANQGPRYPLDLRMNNVEGDVVAEFVVDSAGAVDETTLRILLQTRTEFGRAVTDWLKASEFYPQRDRGVPVCQRVIEPVSFRLDK